jgi:hypothetical protein
MGYIHHLIGQDRQNNITIVLNRKLQAAVKKKEKHTNIRVGVAGLWSNGRRTVKGQ